MVLPLPVRASFTATIIRAYAAPLALLPGWGLLGFLPGLLLGFLPVTASLAETVLLDFSSPTCGPCQEMQPIVRRLVADGLPVREIDITREPQLAARYGVTRVPTFLVVVDGRPVDQVVGSTTYGQLHHMLRRAMPASPPRQPHAPLGQSPSSLAPPAQGRTGLAAVTPAPRSSDPLPPSTASVQPRHQQQPVRPVAPPDRVSSPVRPPGERLQIGANPPVVNRLADLPSGHPSPVASSLSSAHQRLLAATVKITVEDAQGKSAGTGTIVDARSGEALILTCGHIFRSSGGKGPIAVTTFQVGASGATPSATYRGHLIDFDLDRDLALVSMRPTAPVTAVSIAVQPLIPGAAVTSVGCNHGQNPTAIDSQVTTNDRYQGPPNVEVAGAPVEGRSGGGLFNVQGELTGVCFAADPAANEGLYAALPSIHSKLDSLELTMIYRPSQADPPTVPVALTPPAVVNQETLIAVRGQDPEPASSLASVPPGLAGAPPVPTAVAGLPASERAALEEIQRRGANSEVICIIRPQDPAGQSEVITLRNVSPAFVRALANPTVPSTRRDPEQAAATASADPFYR